MVESVHLEPIVSGRRLGSFTPMRCDLGIRIYNTKNRCFPMVSENKDMVA
jgi:hypothetical protein